MKRNLYTFNSQKLNDVMNAKAISNEMLAELLGQSANSRAIVVRIGQIRNGGVTACEYEFLNKVETTLNLEKGSFVGSPITKKTIERNKLGNSLQKENLKAEISGFLKSSNQNISVPRSVLDRVMLYL